MVLNSMGDTKLKKRYRYRKPYTHIMSFILAYHKIAEDCEALLIVCVVQHALVQHMHFMHMYCMVLCLILKMHHFPLFPIIFPYFLPAIF